MEIIVLKSNHFVFEKEKVKFDRLMKKKKSVKYTAIERRRRKLVINRKFKLSLPKFEFHCI